MIYLDSNATTQVHPDVVDAMLPYLGEQFYNPSSGYRAGKKVKAAIDEAREKVATLINARADEIVFTGCGTESNNMALKWLSRLVGRKNSRVVTSQIEHSAVLRPCETFAEVGFSVANVGVESDGRLDLDAYRAACAEVTGDTRGFASIMWANNETGVIQPIAQAVEIAKSHNMGFHTDAIQAIGKVPIDVRDVPVDFLSISGHKFHAPKGVGALYCRSGARFEPMIRGGGQESGRRSGTENVPYIIGLGKAAELMISAREDGSLAKVETLRNRLENGLLDRVDGVTLNGSRDHRTGNVAHVSIDGCDAGSMLILLDQRGVLCSAGSACMTGKSQPSHVQTAMGIPVERAKTSLRLSLSIFTTEAEIDDAIEHIATAAKKIRDVQGPGVGPVVVYG